MRTIENGNSKPARSGTQLSLFQFGLFAIVGAAGTFVHYAILLLLVDFFDIKALVGSIVGSIGGACVNFFRNHRVTFQSSKRFFQTAPRFFLLTGFSLDINAALMYFFNNALTSVISFSNY